MPNASCVPINGSHVLHTQVRLIRSNRFPMMRPWVQELTYGLIAAEQRRWHGSRHGSRVQLTLVLPSIPDEISLNNEAEIHQAASGHAEAQKHPDRHTGRQGKDKQHTTAAPSFTVWEQLPHHSVPQVGKEKELQTQVKNTRPWNEIRISQGAHHTEEQSHSQWFFIKKNI